MKLSVIIVNYNVEYFLEQCLHSVFRALERVDGEVFVVDNRSVDGSVEMVRNKFPQVRLIANQENVGFSRANNQAIEKAEGEYILLLNPDTVVEEDTFEKIVHFMDEHPDAGGLGVKMLDGKGRFLPESKRGLPTPEVAFYKIFGLSSLFPRSRKFGKYHLGYLDKDQTHEVEILSGAFMLLRKKALDEVGVLDNTFFMYGEDIDLSYRLIKGGYKNYYYPHTRIIHYKGESTKKSSINYVFVFYRAMLIFADKHFSPKNLRLLSYLINFAIYLRAGVAIVNRFIRRISLPMLDAALMLGGAFVIKDQYEVIKGIDYSEKMVWIAFPLYVLVWMLSVWLGGGYDKPVRYLRIIKGLIAGTVLILVGYALLPESYRFSRALILFNAVWATMVFLGTRVLLGRAGVKGYGASGNANKRFAIVAYPEEGERIRELLRQTQGRVEMTGIVSPDVDQDFDRDKGIIGNIDHLRELVNIHRIDEVIFSARDVPAQRMIDLMSSIDRKDIDHKVAPPESLYIIGSSSVDRSGELYMIDINSVSRTENRRNKRILDLLVAFFLLVTLPVNVFWVRNKWNYVRNIFRVLIGERSWVGYYEGAETDRMDLPYLRKGVLHPLIAIKDPEGRTEETAQKLNVIYAKDYRVWNDLELIIKGFPYLGGEEGRNLTADGP